jgi:hypothetical protein
MPSMSGRGPSKKRPRGSKKGPEPIASVLLRASGGESRDGSPLPPRAWHDAVGDRISRRTRPMRLERGVLTVRAATAAWAQELTFVAPTIIERLNALGFEVDALRFRVGPIEALAEPVRLPAVKSIPAARPLPHDLARELEHVRDPDLRESITRAASANLAWQTARSATSVTPVARAPRSAVPRSDPQDHKPTNFPGAGRRKT